MSATIVPRLGTIALPTQKITKKTLNQRVKEIMNVKFVGKDSL